MADKKDGSDTGERLVLISTVIVPQAMEDGFIAWWKLAAPYMKAQPGFVSARLHRSLDQKERYRFVNTVEWRGGAAQRDAIAAFWTSLPQPQIPGLEWRPAFYEVVAQG